MLSKISRSSSLSSKLNSPSESLFSVTVSLLSIDKSYLLKKKCASVESLSKFDFKPFKIILLSTSSAFKFTISWLLPITKTLFGPQATSIALKSLEAS